MTVSDNGIGITTEALPKVHELVEAHDGSLVASSAGSRFDSQFVVTTPLIGR
jgi:signal transduction histidine kinase